MRQLRNVGAYQTMPAKTPETFSHVELLRRLAFDPETGVFNWRISPSHRVKIGTPAGLALPDGRSVITVQGRRYYKHRLAWFYLRGEWPPEGWEPRFADFDNSNCSLANLSYVRPTLSEDPHAIAARKSQRRRRALQKQNAIRQTSPIAHIVQSPLTSEWQVFHPEDNGLKYLIGNARTLGKATEMYYERLAGVDFVNAHPAPIPLFTELHTLAGDEGSLTLAEARVWLAYDPRTGAFYRRAQHSRTKRRAKLEGEIDLAKGERADELNTNGSPVIGFFGRDYPAASMAVFMRQGVWPARRTVRFKDGDKTNTAWANITVHKELAE
jgi:hypothetical protein